MKLSQLDLLKEEAARLDRPGQDNPFVKGLKAQIASIEKPRADNPMQSISVGMRSAPQTSSNTEDETRTSITDRLARMTVQQRAKLFDDLL